MRANAPSTQSASSGECTAHTILSAGVGAGRSPGLNSSSWIFSPRRRPTISIADVHLGLQSGQPDHVLRQLDDPHQFAHLEHEHLAAGGQLTGADDQLDRLGIVMK